MPKASKVAPAACKSTARKKPVAPAVPAERKPRPVPDCVVNFNSLPDAAGIPGPAVDCLFGISQATRWRHISAGKLPKADRFGRYNVGALRAVLKAAA